MRSYCINFRRGNLQEVVIWGQLNGFHLLKVVWLLNFVPLKLITDEREIKRASKYSSNIDVQSVQFISDFSGSIFVLLNSLKVVHNYDPHVYSTFEYKDSYLQMWILFISVFFQMSIHIKIVDAFIANVLLCIIYWLVKRSDYLFSIQSDFYSNHQRFKNKIVFSLNRSVK